MRLLLLFLIVVGVLLCGCSGQPTPAGPAREVPATSPVATALEPEPGGAAPADGGESSRIMPSDFAYLGAFRLPGASGGSSWSYGGYAATYDPAGDPAGAGDGYPGSLFAIGHDQDQQVSEISIPAPVISTSKSPGELNVATTLQPFASITNGLFGPLEIPRAGLEYLPPQAGLDAGRLYFSWGQHFEFDWSPSFGTAGTDLSAPKPAGPWHLDGYSPYVTNDYMFAIPEGWGKGTGAAGLPLATGRFRDGLWGGRGPALFAYRPWDRKAAFPPAGGTLQEVVPLLLYGEQVPGALEIASDESQAMRNFSEADEWSGGEWLTAGGRSAVVFVGTKAQGETWYGFANGVEYPTSGAPGEAYPEVPPWPYDQRGWWSEGVEAQILFFDPADLAAVAAGRMETWKPQPYAVMSLDPYLFDPGFDHERGKRYLVGDTAYDRERGLLYVFERMADEDEKSVVHVFRLDLPATVRR